MHIPCDVLVFNVAPHLEPADQLSLAMSCQEVHRSFFNANPQFRTLYSRKHRCGAVLKRMIEFVRRGPTSVASWTLLCGSREMLVCRLQRSLCCVPGEFVEDVFEWFSANMWGRRIDVSTRCYYKKKERRDEFMALTGELLQALGASQYR